MQLTQPRQLYCGCASSCQLASYFAAYLDGVYAGQSIFLEHIDSWSPSTFTVYRNNNDNAHNKTRSDCHHPFKSSCKQSPTRIERRTRRASLEPLRRRLP